MSEWRISSWRGVSDGADSSSLSVCSISDDATRIPDATFRMAASSSSFGRDFVMAPVAPFLNARDRSDDVP